MDLSAPPNASPMMVAYAAARTAAPGHLVLYRVGEFYEVLFDDAVVVSRALGIQLTRRRQKDAADVPMCGVPAASAGSAVNRLLASRTQGRVVRAAGRALRRTATATHDAGHIRGPGRAR
jgi:DNA mismatch repair protein MutS